jgi:hypothetical protein
MVVALAFLAGERDSIASEVAMNDSASVVIAMSAPVKMDGSSGVTDE